MTVFLNFFSKIIAFFLAIIVSFILIIILFIFSQNLQNNALFTLKKGDVLIFPGDCRHSYRNPKREEMQGISVIVW